MSKTVLVIDQNQDRLSKITDYWRREPWRTITASSLQEGIDLLEDERIDMLIVTELQDWLSGTEFLELTHHRYPGMIRILVTEEISKQVTVDVNDDAENCEFRAESVIHHQSPHPYDTQYMTRIIHAMFGTEETVEGPDRACTAYHR